MAGPAYCIDHDGRRGPTDAALLGAVARVTVALEAAHQQTLEHGQVTRTSARSLPQISASAYLERKLSAELRTLLDSLGMTPQGRLKCAPPMTGRASGDAKEWGDLAP